MKKYWTIDKCHVEALEYSSKIDFKIGSPKAYYTARKNKWIDDICEHMISKRDIWKKDELMELAMQYKSHALFQKNEKNAYAAARYHGWLDDIISHMKMSNHNKWTYDDILLESQKYSSRNDFRKRSSGAYHAAWKNNLLDDVCKHMIELGNIMLRCIYAFEFDDNYVYVGLTSNILKRKENHLTNHGSAVFQHIQKFNTIPKLIQLTDYVDIKNAALLEGIYAEKYVSNGWKILNKMKTGGIGGNLKLWTKEMCETEAKKYKTKIEFYNSSNKAYNASCRNGWIDEISTHMINGRMKWTIEACTNEARLYSKRSEFKKMSSGAYSACVKNKWLNRIFEKEEKI